MMKQLRALLGCLPVGKYLCENPSHFFHALQVGRSSGYPRTELPERELGSAALAEVAQ
jgi:hypothetical protein